MNFLQQLFRQKLNQSQDTTALFIESMLIMIAADGVVEDAEMEQFMRQLNARSEVEEVGAEALEEHIRTAFDAIKRDGIEERLSHIAGRLTDPEDRLAALSMAAAIAVEDGVVASAESEVVRMMQRAFGLDDGDVETALETARQTRLDEVEADAQGVDSKAEHGFVEVLLLMAAADGILEPRELERFGQQLVERPEFGALGADQVGLIMDQALRDLQRDGLSKRLDVIAEHLTQPEQRLMAFQMALEMCIADGTADPHERTLLKLLQERFKLSDDVVSAEIERVLIHREG
ncbi:MAG: hypothetical protein CMH57_09180 [Myxococcales bacterium]|nr:hypothetical protein [Myxococcales bacterium]